MTVTTASLHITDNGAAAEPVRRFYGALFDGRQGVAAAADLAVTEKSGTANMSVDVAGGACLITGDESSSQGAYWLDNVGVLNVAITAADATNPRKDLIVAKVQDSDYSGATDAGSIVVVDGTPAGSPSEPAVPDNAIVLALVDVAALATSIVDANITDRRTSTTGQDRLATTGGILVAASTAQLPSSPTEGLIAWQSDTNQLMGYNGSAWINIVQPEWQTWVPVWDNGGGPITHTANRARYILAGDSCTVSFKLTSTQASGSSSAILEIPFDMAATYGTTTGPVGIAEMDRGGTDTIAWLQPTTTIDRVQMVLGNGGVYAASISVGDVFSGTLTYEIA